MRRSWAVVLVLVVVLAVVVAWWFVDGPTWISQMLTKHGTYKY